MFPSSSTIPSHRSSWGGAVLDLRLQPAPGGLFQAALFGEPLRPGDGAEIPAVLEREDAALTRAPLRLRDPVYRLDEPVGKIVLRQPLHRGGKAPLAVRNEIEMGPVGPVAADRPAGLPAGPAPAPRRGR